MKRILSAVFLAIAIILIIIWGNTTIENTCESSLVVLQQCKINIENGNFIKANENINSLPKIDCIVKFVNKEDITQYKRCVDELLSSIRNKNVNESKLKINSCIYLINEIASDKSLTINCIY